MQPDPWWEAVNRLEALLLDLLAGDVRLQRRDERPDAAVGSLPFLHQMPAGYVKSCSELLDYAVPLGDDWPGVPAMR